MRYAAFLRAINVGKHNRITMVQLRELCERAGFTGVSTYLQSGNLLFETDLPEEAAAGTLEAAFVAHGLKNAPAIVRSLPDLASIVSGNPFRAFPEAEFTRFVTLFREPLSETTRVKAHEQDLVVGVRERELLTVAPVVRERGLDPASFLPKNEKMLGTSRYFHVVEEVARLLQG